MFLIGDRVRIQNSDGTEWVVVSNAVTVSGCMGIRHHTSVIVENVPEIDLVDQFGICSKAYGWGVGDYVCLVGDATRDVYTIMVDLGGDYWAVENSVKMRIAEPGYNLLMATPTIQAVHTPLFIVGDLVDLIGSPDPAGWWVRASHGHGQYKIEHSVTMAIIDPVFESSMTFNPKTLVRQLQASLIATTQRSQGIVSQTVVLPRAAQSNPPPKKPVCECGATKCGSKIHSSWCPIA